MEIKLVGKRLHWSAFVLLIVIFSLLIWSFQQLSWKEITKLLTSFSFQEISILAVLNLLIFGLFAYRWTIIQTAMDNEISIQKMFAYRLIGFGISYFTPGPQIGGEPAQVMLLRQNHNTSSEKAISSVFLDRIIDALVNFVILTFGLFVLLSNNFFKEFKISFYFYAFISLLIIPLAYLILLSSGLLPLSKPLNKIRSRINKKHLFEMIGKLIGAEFEMSRFIRKHPSTFLKVVLVSIVSWGFMIYEYWLMLHFMGVTVNGLTLVSAITTARLAFLTPMPAGLGALEASQVWVMQLLGLSSSIGISAALYIRIRDSIFGLSGLLLASVFLPKRNAMKEVTI